MSAANLRTWLAWCDANADDKSLESHERDLWTALALQINDYLEEHG